MTKRKFMPTIVMAVFTVLLLGVHFFFGWRAYVHTSASHGEVASVSVYTLEWARDTAANMRAEFSQLFILFLILTGVLSRYGIANYDKDLEEIKERLDRIEYSVAQLLNK